MSILSGSFWRYATVVLTAAIVVIIATSSASYASTGNALLHQDSVPDLVVQVEIDGQRAQVRWEPIPGATGYRVAWVNIPELLEAQGQGLGWRERLAYTDLPAERLAHTVAHLQAETQHAFTVGAEIGGDAISWSTWQFADTGKDPCPCEITELPPGQTGDDPDSEALLAHITVLGVARQAVVEHRPEIADRLQDLKLVYYETVTWPDGSLGCRQEGYAYTSALVPGHIVRFQLDAETITVHLSDMPLHGFVPTNCIQ